ncbi:MAG: PD40 domain-containing protein [Gemmatimonadaceae bacterium]|nr:PD40 domain-containing protein [Gemmatimonadaceae bacterium]
MSQHHIAADSRSSAESLVGRITRRTSRWWRTTAVGVAIWGVACSGAGSGSPTGPGHVAEHSGSDSLAVPDFVFVSDASGVDQLYRYTGGTITRLTHSDLPDTDPQSAAGRLVFTSFRDGNGEVYIATLDGDSATRLTTSDGDDREPALSPDGARIVFVSDRSGVPRLWIMDATGAHQAALATGSAGYTPERAPTWSPDGAQIAFTSTRSGISQVYLVAPTGGNAVQLTHESGGAFDPAWSADGTQIYYAAGSSPTRIRVITVATGAASDYAQLGGDAPPSLGEPACTATICLAVRGAYGTTGDIVAYPGPNTHGTTLVGTGANEHSPAFLVP